MIRLLAGDCRDVLATLDAGSIDACVTDPPYHLMTDKRGGTGIASLNLDSPAGRSRVTTGFMGKAWDGGGVSFDPDTWRAVWRVLKPGAHLLAFGGTRTQHRMVCAIEDAGFEIRDTLCWLYGSGFPKSLNVSKAIDRAAGAVREVVGTKRNNKADSGPQIYAALGEFQQSAYSDITAPATPEAAQWEGWGTALKPAVEMIVLARKPLSERTVAANVLRWGCGALNVDACRIEATDSQLAEKYASVRNAPPRDNAIYGQDKRARSDGNLEPHAGRWPSNCCHDGSPEVLAAFAAQSERAGIHSAGAACPPKFTHSGNTIYGDLSGAPAGARRGDTGSAARFFKECKWSEREIASRFHYTSKADAADRADSRHPTIKPVSLLRWLAKLITPPGGHILDPFAGSGTTGEAAMLQGFEATLIEQDPASVADIRHRMSRWSGGDMPLFREFPLTDPADERMADLFAEPSTK